MDFKKLKKLLQEKRFVFISRLHKDYQSATIFLVGGAVRDLMLNLPIPPSDLDFVVEGIKRDELEKFLEKNGIVKDVESRAFGVFIFVPKQQAAESFDIALPRDEHWIGKGYKDIEVNYKGLTLVEDLSRRDFTINAMAIGLKTYKLIDEFGGQKDLKNKIIRTVGNPIDRFQEDPSRILRGIRFAVQLGFGIEKKTFLGMKNKLVEITKPLENDISKKRVAEEIIAKEFLKAFDKDPVKTLKLYDQVGLLKLLMPGVKAMQEVEQPKNFHSEGDVYEHTLLALEKLSSCCHSVLDTESIDSGSESGMTECREASINLKLATLFHDIGKPATFTPPKDKNDRIHFNEHDEKGAEIVGQIIDRLKLNSLTKDGPLHVDREVVVWLVRKHMILVTAKPEEMRLTTFEKYFFREDGAGDDLLRLSYADISATIPPGGLPDFSVYNNFVKKIDEVREAVHSAKKERTLPSPLINGNEVMKALKIKSGPKVGKVLAQIREQQLSGKLKTKKEALLFLSKYRQN